MNKIVVYKSSTGFTKQYAEWIASELGCVSVSMKQAKKMDLSEYDIFIYGGHVMAGIVSGWKNIRENMQNLEPKKLIVFAVGSTGMDCVDKIKDIHNANFTPEEQQNIPFYYFQGGINYNKMGFFGKMVLRMLKKGLAKSDNRSKEDDDMLELLQNPKDLSNKEYIAPLLSSAESSK